MVLHGPPGTGKTTLARLLAQSAGFAFEELSAVEAGKAEVRAVLERARHRRRTSGEGTVLFLDELHRFNKAQQDALLPAVEDGTVVLVGATTENPYFEVNGALLSRTRVYELRALEPEDVLVLLRRTGVAATDEALAFLARRSAGDARTALGALELASDTADGAPVDLPGAELALQRKAISYDRAGDRHFDLISAWIKATRGSDPDASLYYLAVMLEGGEDPRYVVRRMVVLASEDVGNADPQALVVATAAAAAVEHVGMPECQFALAQCAIYLALAPKSNAGYRALAAAREHVQRFGAAPPPVALLPGRRGEGYDYPHDRPGHVSGQELMPDGLAGTRFYARTTPRGRCASGSRRSAPRAPRRASGRIRGPSRRSCADRDRGHEPVAPGRGPVRTFGRACSSTATTGSTTGAGSACGSRTCATPPRWPGWPTSPSSTPGGRCGPRWRSARWRGTAPTRPSSASGAWTATPAPRSSGRTRPWRRSSGARCASARPTSAWRRPHGPPRRA
jgi:putative ATPase